MKLLFFTFILKFTLDISYNYYVVPTWSSFGFISDFDWIVYTIVSFTIGIPFFINNKKNNPSNFAISILLIGVLLPLATLSSFQAVPLDWYFYNLIFFISITFVDFLFDNYKLNELEFNFFKFYNTIFALLIGLFSLHILSYGISIDFSLLSWDSFLIYNVRNQFNATSTGGLIAYLLENLSMVVIPACGVYAVLFRKYILLILSIFAILVIFSTSAAKGILVAPFASIFIAILLTRKIIDNQFDVIKVSILSSSVLFIIISLVNDPVFLSAVFYWRTIFLPSLISSFYFDFFQFHEFTYFKDSGIFSFFIGDSYPVDVKKMVANFYLYKNPLTNMNVGLVADGFLKMGVTGIIVTGIFLNIILKLINEFARNKNQVLVKSIMFYPIYGLVNGSFYTALLTKGLVGLLIIIILLDNNKEGKYINV